MERKSCSDMPENIVFIACGSYNPPTPMHFRMFEIARDHFKFTERCNVIGGIISPVHDAYKKQNVQLASSEHRCKMVNLSILSSEWIRLSEWECKQTQWTSTRENQLNSILNDDNEHNKNIASWIPSNINEIRGQRVHVKLLCGADLLESFANEEQWSHAEVESILREHGLVVIARNGSDPQKFLFQSDLMFKNKANVTIIENWVPSEISSTLVRMHIRRGLSVKHLLNDNVIGHIYKRKLYDSQSERRALISKQRPKDNNSNCTNENFSPNSAIDSRCAIADLDVTDNNNLCIDQTAQIYPVNETSNQSAKDSHLASTSREIQEPQCDQTLIHRKRKYSLRNNQSSAV